VSTDDKYSMEIADWFKYYLNEQLKMKKLYSPNIKFETARSINAIWYDPDKDDDFPQIRKAASSWCVLWNDGKPIFLRINQTHSFTSTHGSFVPESVTIEMYIIFSILYGKNFFGKFIDKTMEFYRKKIYQQQRIYKSYRGRWSSLKLKIPQKFNDGTYILTPQMNKVVEGIRKFLLPETRDKYKHKGFGYCRKICAYGPPGSGKSELILRIAGEYNMPVYYLACDGVGMKLSYILDNTKHGIVIIEEIDKCICYQTTNKHNDKPIQNNTIPQKEIHNNGYPTLVQWHNALDKIMGTKVIIYMTTNNIDTLEKINHGSIIRPGRVDQKIEIGYVNKQFIEDILYKYFGVTDIYAEDELNGDIFLTPADIINIIKESDDDINTIKQLIRQQNIEKSKKED